MALEDRVNARLGELGEALKSMGPQRERPHSSFVDNVGRELRLYSSKIRIDNPTSRAIFQAEEIREVKVCYGRGPRHDVSVVSVIPKLETGRRKKILSFNSESLADRAAAAIRSVQRAD